MAANASSFGISIGLDAAICVIILLFFGFFRRTSWTEKFYEPKRYNRLVSPSNLLIQGAYRKLNVLLQLGEVPECSKTASQELCRVDCAYVQIQ